MSVSPAGRPYHLLPASRSPSKMSSPQKGSAALAAQGSLRTTSRPTTRPPSNGWRQPEQSCLARRIATSSPWEVQRRTQHTVPYGTQLPWIACLEAPAEAPQRPWLLAWQSLHSELTPEARSASRAPAAESLP